jgi:hypothetical protein
MTTRSAAVAGRPLPLAPPVWLDALDGTIRG